MLHPPKHDSIPRRGHPGAAIEGFRYKRFDVSFGPDWRCTSHYQALACRHVVAPRLSVWVHRLAVLVGACTKIAELSIGEH
jgi:hypothetical protein